MKTCARCGEEKDIDLFIKHKRMKDGLDSYCKTCRSQRNAHYHAINHDKITAKMRKRYHDNKDTCRERSREYWQKNKAKKAQKDKRYTIKNKEKIAKRNRLPEVKNRRNELTRKRRQNPKHRININITNAIGTSLRGSKGGRKWESLVGYTIQDLMIHLEKQFQVGMSWDNIGKWHIDHIIPLSVHNFNKPEDEDFKRAWALNNLQPLWAKDNYIKSNKLNQPFQPSLIL